MELTFEHLPVVYVNKLIHTLVNHIGLTTKDKSYFILNISFQLSTKKGIYTAFSASVLPDDNLKSLGLSGMCRRSCHHLSQPTQNHSEPTEIMEIHKL